MNPNRDKQQWLRTVPPLARRAIREIMAGFEQPGPHLNHSAAYRWSVLLTPLVGTASDVVLIARNRDGREYRWPVMRHGVLLEQEKRVRERR